MHTSTLLLSTLLYHRVRHGCSTDGLWAPGAPALCGKLARWLRPASYLPGCAAHGAGRRLLAEPASISDPSPNHRYAAGAVDTNAAWLCMAHWRTIAHPSTHNHALPALPGGPRRGARPLADAGAGAAAPPDDGRYARRRQQRIEDDAPAPRSRADHR